MKEINMSDEEIYAWFVKQVFSNHSTAPLVKLIALAFAYHVYILKIDPNARDLQYVTGIELTNIHLMISEVQREIQRIKKIAIEDNIR